MWINSVYHLLIANERERNLVGEAIIGETPSFPRDSMENKSKNEREAIKK